MNGKSHTRGPGIPGAPRSPGSPGSPCEKTMQSQHKRDRAQLNTPTHCWLWMGLEQGHLYRGGSEPPFFVALLSSGQLLYPILRSSEYKWRFFPSERFRLEKA